SAALKPRRGGLETYPGRQSWGQHKGADDPCKIVAVGALPTVSTISFPIVQRQDARLLTGESRFESWSGSQSEHFLEKACPGLDPGWTPVFRRTCDQA